MRSRSEQHLWVVVANPDVGRPTHTFDDFFRRLAREHESDVDVDALAALDALERVLLQKAPGSVTPDVVNRIDVSLARIDSALEAHRLVCSPAAPRPDHAAADGADGQEAAQGTTQIEEAISLEKHRGNDDGDAEIQPGHYDDNHKIQVNNYDNPEMQSNESAARKVAASRS